MLETPRDLLQVGCAEPGLEQQPLDAEPRGEPIEHLVGRHRLAALDLAHVLLREPSSRELDLRHPRRPAQVADAAPDSRRRRGTRCATHHDPTVRFLSPVLPDVLPCSMDQEAPAAAAGGRHRSAVRDGAAGAVWCGLGVDRLRDPVLARRGCPGASAAGGAAGAGRAEGELRVGQGRN